MIYFIVISLVFAQLSSALPYVRPRRLPNAEIKANPYADNSFVLRESLRKEWYTDVNEQKAVNISEKPRDIYSCKGPKMDDYPKMNEWLSFEQLWQINEGEISLSNNCTNNRTTDFTKEIKDAIVDVSRESFVDARLILALIMQESTGNVNVACTGAENSDCGIMQIRGSREFQSNSTKESIRHMIEDGVYGTPRNEEVGATKGWPGFAHYFDAPDDDLKWVNPDDFWRGNPFAAAHIYNAGAITSDNLTEADGGIDKNQYYSNDIASRLSGWNGRRSGCLKSITCSGLGFEGRQCDELDE
ncbi:hypothetical protein BS50DRAFT_301781 [Corynespora cassiicola Philippines]|uniref:Transglycosylase SLT domain-containing protein n=1 Tax=Corynespora cassiicola Philippines TaxID=1448308 RepID=A0A2T2NX25_CORCC|nr:hypothetical protein BS50DRAFT_301781 [Corynespora cassiicola Philippines]